MIKIISNDFNKKRGRPIFVRPFHLFLLNFFCKIVNLTNHRYNTIHDQSIFSKIADKKVENILRWFEIVGSQKVSIVQLNLAFV